MLPIWSRACVPNPNRRTKPTLALWPSFPRHRPSSAKLTLDAGPAIAWIASWGLSLAGALAPTRELAVTLQSDTGIRCPTTARTTDRRMNARTVRATDLLHSPARWPRPPEASNRDRRCGSAKLEDRPAPALSETLGWRVRDNPQSIVRTPPRRRVQSDRSGSMRYPLPPLVMLLLRAPAPRQARDRAARQEPIRRYSRIAGQQGMIRGPPLPMTTSGIPP